MVPTRRRTFEWEIIEHRLLVSDSTILTVKTCPSIYVISRRRSRGVDSNYHSYALTDGRPQLTEASTTHSRHDGFSPHYDGPLFILFISYVKRKTRERAWQLRSYNNNKPASSARSLVDSARALTLKKQNAGDYTGGGIREEQQQV